MNCKMHNKTLIEKALFSSKWLLLPFYFSLMIGLAVYAYIDVKELIHLVLHIRTISEDAALMSMLKLIDLAMIANLVKLIIIGSYTSFFKKHVDNDPTPGNILTDPNLNTSSGVLKVKMATSIVGVTSISLLQTFIKPDISEAMFQKQIIIHVVFLIGAAILSAIDWMHVKAEAIHHEDCIKHKTNH